MKIFFFYIFIHTRIILFLKYFVVVAIVVCGQQQIRLPEKIAQLSFFFVAKLTFYKYFTFVMQCINHVQRKFRSIRKKKQTC